MNARVLVADRLRAERAGMSEALLGTVAALVADASEIISAVVALANHQGEASAKVVVGSNVFNPAELLGPQSPLLVLARSPGPSYSNTGAPAP